MTAGDPYIQSGDEPMSGNCRLVYKGFHQLELRRCGDGQIVIGGQARTLQEPPPTVTSRLPVDTDQYIYARWDEPREKIKLEASTTGPISLAGPGQEMEVKEGEPEKTLVGMGRPFEQRHRHYHWAHRPDSLRILTWHNRRPRSDRTHLRGDRETASAEWDEAAVDFRLEFLTWAGETVRLTVSGEVRCGGTRPCLALGFGGIVPAAEVSLDGSDPPGAWRPFALTAEARFEAAPGHHFATLLARTDAGVPTTVRGGATLSAELMG